MTEFVSDPARRRTLKAAGALAAGAFALLAGFPPEARAADPVVWKFAHTSPIPGTVWNTYAVEVLPQRIKEATGGQVEVQVVSGVVRPADLLSSIRNGQVHGGSLLFPYVSPTLPLWNVLSLPGLVKADENYPALLNEIVFPVVAADAKERYKAVPMAMGTFPGAYFFSNGPIDTVDKFKGHKYRAHSPELVRMVLAAGGSAVSMPFGDLYGALQRRMVDAYTSAIPPVSAAKLYEVTKYAENWPAGLGAFAYFIGVDALAALSPELREKIEQAMSKLNAEAQAATLEEVSVGVEELKRNGVTFVDVAPAEREKALELARKHAWTAWLENTGDQGRELVHRIEAAQ